MRHYYYDGPVYFFNRIIEGNYFAETWATSKKKAISNICYQYKRKTGRTANGGKISLEPNHLIELEED